MQSKRRWCKGIVPIPISLKKGDLHLEFLEEEDSDTDGGDGCSHEEHIQGCSEFHQENPLEETDDEHHDDNLDDLVLEVIEAGDLKEGMEGFRSPRAIDPGDCEFVDPETEDQEYHADQVQVDSADDPAQHGGVIDLKGRQGNGMENGAYYLGGSRDKEQHRAYRAEYDCKKDNKTRIPERGFEKPFISGLFLCFFQFFQGVRFHHMVMDTGKFKTGSRGSICGGSLAWYRHMTQGKESHGIFSKPMFRGTLLKSRKSDEFFLSSDFALLHSRL